MARLALLWKLAVLMTETAGMQAAGPPHGNIDSNCLLQLPVEDASRNTSSAAEASVRARPVEEIASEELGAMENIMGKELGVMDKALGVMEQSMGKIVDMKEVELGAVKREQGTAPAWPQEVEGPEPFDEPQHTPVSPLTSGAQEDARGATQNGARAVQHVLGGRVLTTDPWENSNVSILDLELYHTDLQGFTGGFFHGDYGYLVPFYSGAITVGKVPRIDLTSFTVDSVLDMAEHDNRLRGFQGGFTDGTYGYLTPYYASGYHGKIGRFDLANFDLQHVAVLDLEAEAGLTRYRNGFHDGTHGFLIPVGRDVARFDLATFSFAGSLDVAAAANDNDFAANTNGCFHDKTYGYLLNAGEVQKVARIHLADFSYVDKLDFGTVDLDLKQFYSGFSDGTYGYATTCHGVDGVKGKVPRFDLQTFSNVEVVYFGEQDPTLKACYIGGFIDGTYGYVIPWWNGVHFGTVVRFDLVGFNTVPVAALDITRTDANAKGFHYGFTDGNYGYACPYQNPALGYHGRLARFGVIQHVPDVTLGGSVSGGGSGGSPSGGDPDQSSVVGDPHVVTVAKVRFEIRAEGTHKLVQVPRFISANGKPDLRVDARIEHFAGNDCSKSFMTSLSIFGRWTEDAAFGLMHITQGSDMPNTTLLVNTEDPEAFFKEFPSPLPDTKAGRASLAFKLKGVGFRVGKHYAGRYGKQRAYLNVRITGLKQYKDLGGLLGYDDHAGAEMPDAGCTAARPATEYESSFVGIKRSVPSTDDPAPSIDDGSRIEAE